MPASLVRHTAPPQAKPTKSLIRAPTISHSIGICDCRLMSAFPTIPAESSLSALAQIWTSRLAGDKPEAKLVTVAEAAPDSMAVVR